MSNCDWVFWLNLTNIALGMVVPAVVLLVAGGLVWDWMIRHMNRRDLPDLDEEMLALLRDEFAHSIPVHQIEAGCLTKRAVSATGFGR